MIKHFELLELSGFPTSFALVGEYLRGAATEVEFERDGMLRRRTHMIVDADDFPRVMIGVEGATTSPHSRQLFSPTDIYGSAQWELADPRDEDALRALVENRRTKDAAARAAGEAELARRQAMRAAEEREAASMRAAEFHRGAFVRLIEAFRTVQSERRLAAILRDLSVVIDRIDRENDRIFVADIAARQGRWASFRFTEPQARWLNDILERTGRRLDHLGRAESGVSRSSSPDATYREQS